MTDWRESTEQTSIPAPSTHSAVEVLEGIQPFFYIVQVVKRTFMLEIFRPPLEGFALSNNIKVGMN